jgi:methionyl-tRNA formyltransferase
MPERKKIVFLGTPAVVVPVLERLLAANDFFTVIAVVSQLPARAPRGQSVVPSPVHKRAAEAGIKVMTPENAKSAEFIDELRGLNPDLCVTAAYGQVLSEEFLAVPKFGTLNIHPSLLPLYRGAAPVQRALEDGVSTTGVTIARTVRAMDAGPVVDQEKYTVDDSVQAPELLAKLFEIGAEKLVRILPDYFAGRIDCRHQQHELATKAKKMLPEEGLLQPEVSGARTLHNRVRAFAGWPGTRLRIYIADEQVEVKVLKTRVSPVLKAKSGQIIFSDEGLELVCGDGSVLIITDLQAPGKRALSAREFWNGLRSKTLRWV